MPLNKQLDFRNDREFLMESAMLKISKGKIKYLTLPEILNIEYSYHEFLKRNLGLQNTIQQFLKYLKTEVIKHEKN